MAGGLQGSGRAVPGMDMRILKSRPQQAGPVFVRQREQRLGCEKVLLVFTEQHTLGAQDWAQEANREGAEAAVKQSHP